MEEFRRKCKESFAYYAAFETECGDTELADGAVVSYFDEFHIGVCNFLQFGGTRKVLVIPRGFLKSHLGARLYPIWKSLHWPDHRTLVAGNTSFNARKRIREIKDTLENPVCKHIWPDIIPASTRKVRWSDDCTDVLRPHAYSDGTFESAGLGKAIIGQHKNLIVEDDTSCPDVDDLSTDFVMPSRQDIEQAVGWHRTIYPILINPMHDEILIITTRWCFYDLVDWVTKNEDNYTVYERPAEDGQFGNILYPNRFSAKILRQLLVQMGSYRYNALYRNDPRPPEDMIFNPSNVQYYDSIDVEGRVVITFDPIPADSGGGYGNDYAAIIACLHPTQGEEKGNMYVLQYEYGRLTVPQQIDAAINMAIAYGARIIRVESNFFQYDMYIRLQERIKNEGLKVTAEEEKHVSAKSNKDVRILGLTPLFEQHRIFIKRTMKELENEMYQFIPGKKRFSRDDLLDALAMQLTDYRIPSKAYEPVRKVSVNNFDDILKEIRQNRRRTGMRYGHKKQTTPYHVFG